MKNSISDAEDIFLDLEKDEEKVISAFQKVLNIGKIDSSHVIFEKVEDIPSMKTMPDWVNEETRQWIENNRKNK